MESANNSISGISAGNLGNVLFEERLQLIARLEQQGQCTPAVAMALEDAAKLVGTRINTLEEACTYARATFSLAEQVALENEDKAVRVRASPVLEYMSFAGG